MLAELGLCPPILSRLQELIPQNVKDMDKLLLKNIVPKNNGLTRGCIESGLYFPIDSEPTLIDPNVNPQRVFYDY